MEMNTWQQNWSRSTKVNYSDKTHSARVEFQENVILQLDKVIWTENSGKSLSVSVLNALKYCILESSCHLQTNIHYIRISGYWQDEGKQRKEQFQHVEYNLDKPGMFALKSKAQVLNTNVSENDPVKVNNESEAIVIKGAKAGAKIKVYNESGVEVKSMISNNDVVKINLPAKQAYLVHVGNSQYKVAL